MLSLNILNHKSCSKTCKPRRQPLLLLTSFQCERWQGLIRDSLTFGAVSLAEPAPVRTAKLVDRIASGQMQANKSQKANLSTKHASKPASATNGWSPSGSLQIDIGGASCKQTWPAPAQYFFSLAVNLCVSQARLYLWSKNPKLHKAAGSS